MAVSATIRTNVVLDPPEVLDTDIAVIGSGMGAEPWPTRCGTPAHRELVGERPSSYAQMGSRSS